MITSSILSLILKFSALTQYEFAEKIGISQSALSRYIIGEREIPYEVAARITKQIGDHNIFLLRAFDSGLNTIEIDIRKRINENYKNDKGEPKL
ncbi:helix-turn-helix transcriptional regulator [Bacillus cereus group sp. MYBK95-2]|uniref:helix-turn-helix transcriptional regulator n=1 Tax=Bacillus cereus group sp. MYBK95-2 TaxID=3450599 RepID=UPI003F795058